MAYKRIRPIPITEGGTNATSLTNTDGVVYYDGTKLNTTTVGTAAQVLTSNGPGLAPTFQVASGGGGITTLSTDGGTTATGSTVNLQVACVDPDLTVANDGTTRFYATGDTVTLQFEGVTHDEEGGSLFNIGIGANALQALTTNGGNDIAIGTNAGASLTLGQDDILIGLNAGTLLTEGNENIAIGFNALSNSIVGSFNVVMGSNAGQFATGDENVAIGYSSSASESGAGNIAIGTLAGANMATTDSYNIFIGNRNSPVTGLSGAIKIAAFNGSNVLATTSCTIAGIFGATITGSAVLCDSSGLLGTVVSSERFKQNIQPLSDSFSEKIYQLNPKTFNLKRKPDELAWGLIAEEVNEVLPDLVIKDEDGKPFSVKYHELPVLLLQEIKKLRAEINALKGQ